MKKLKVFVVIGYDHAEDEGNPFVRTLERPICDAHKDIEFSSVMSEFWENDNWDIVHVMWPDCFVPSMRNGYDLYERLTFLKNKGTKIIATIHNMTSHHAHFENYYADSYSIVYSVADIMIHLGMYSKTIMEGKYPQANHVHIPHHVYNQMYTSIPSKEEALGFFKYPRGTYVLCMGSFRHTEERKMVYSIMRLFPDIKFIIPKFYDIPKKPINIRWFRQRLKHVYFNIMCPNLYCNHEDFVSDNDLPYYFALSDITLIQRIDTLNSGNIPLGMLMGNVIVGPNVGNMGELLKETANFSFSPYDVGSIKDAVSKALIEAKKGKGAENRLYALSHWSAIDMAEKHYQLYKSICEG